MGSRFKLLIRNVCKHPVCLKIIIKPCLIGEIHECHYDFPEGESLQLQKMELGHKRGVGCSVSWLFHQQLGLGAICEGTGP